VFLFVENKYTKPPIYKQIPEISLKFKWINN